MEDLGTSDGPVPATKEVLRDLSRRGFEDRERQDALFRAEQAGRIAAAAGFGRPDPSDEDVARFGVQLLRIAERVTAMPRVDALLMAGGVQRSESRRFADSLRNAERVELGVDGASPLRSECG